MHYVHLPQMYDLATQLSKESNALLWLYIVVIVRIKVVCVRALFHFRTSRVEVC